MDEKTQIPDLVHRMSADREMRRRIPSGEQNGSRMARTVNKPRRTHLQEMQFPLTRES